MRPSDRCSPLHPAGGKGVRGKGFLSPRPPHQWAPGGRGGGGRRLRAAAAAPPVLTPNPFSGKGVRGLGGMEDATRSFSGSSA